MCVIIRYKGVPVRQMHLYTDTDYNDIAGFADFFQHMKRLRKVFADIVIPFAKQHGLTYHEIDMWIIIPEEDEVVLRMLLPTYVNLKNSSWEK